MKADEIIPESEGLTAASLRDAILSMKNLES